MGRMAYFLILLGYIILHIAGGYFADYINILSNRTIVFYPPVGFGMALLLFFGYRYWPGIVIGQIGVALITGAPLQAVPVFAVAGTLGPLITTFILKHFLQFNNKMERMRDVLGLIFIALPISATILVTFTTSARLLSHTLQPEMFVPIWLSTWISDILSNLIFGVPILLWLSHPIIRGTHWKRIVETVALIGISVFVGIIIFTDNFGKSSPESYLAFFPVIWAALRYGPRETASIVTLYSVMAILSTIQGFGPFVFGNHTENLAYLRSFMLIFTVTSLVLATAIYERKQFERRKDSFIEIASHEMKTPLTSIKMINQLHKKNGITKDQFDVMDEQIDKLTDLTRTLLDLSRIQAEKFRLNKELVKLEDIVETAVNTVSLSNKGRTIVVRKKMKAAVFADKDRIGQVLINLLTNAIKHSDEKSKVFVEITKVRNHAVVSVQDKGVGISKQKLGMIFERFYQISEGEQLEGLGLGLFISSEIIKQHNGRIWVKSEEGKGSTFFFTIPLPRLR